MSKPAVPISMSSESFDKLGKFDLTEYTLLARELHPLISSDLFSDVVFEVEGKTVNQLAAHFDIY